MYNHYKDTVIVYMPLMNLVHETRKVPIETISEYIIKDHIATHTILF